MMNDALAPAGAVTREKVVRRYHAITGLKREKADYYLELHANPRAGVLRKIHEANIRNYSIAVKEIDGQLFRFSYFESVGDDFAADMKKIGDDPETQRWWRETDPCQTPLSDAAAAGKIWSDAREVFYTP